MTDPNSISDDNMLQPLTVETYPDYIPMKDDVQLLLGYWDATASTNRALNNLISKANSFEELKKELLEFIQSRKKFMTCLSNDWDDESFNFKKAIHFVNHS